jgi:hypothetical protein
MVGKNWESIPEGEMKRKPLFFVGTYSKKSPYTICTPEGVDECVSWGDYFSMEALTRLKGGWISYW